MQVFICYSRVDKHFAAQLADDLADYDVTVWMDVRSIPTGANWDMEVQKGLDSSDVILVLLSPASSASQNVADEWSYFIEKNRTIVPVMIEPCDVPFRLSRRQRVDFSTDYKVGFQQLIKALGSPELRDPDSTQKMRPVVREEFIKPATAAPRSQPAKSVDKAAAIPEVGIKTFPMIWADAYHWFNGMGTHATQGEVMISRQEVKLIPHAQPITVIPMRSLVAAAVQRSVDNHLKLTYYGPDGAFRSLVMMGALKASRRETSQELLNLLKLLTGRSLS
ncbi:MAG: toll/interleukin-1 receptor domain-containing protein [Chloroflexota bacterium]